MLNRKWLRKFERVVRFGRFRDLDFRFGSDNWGLKKRLAAKDFALEYQEGKQLMSFYPAVRGSIPLKAD